MTDDAGKLQLLEVEVRELRAQNAALLAQVASLQASSVKSPEAAGGERVNKVENGIAFERPLATTGAVNLETLLENTPDVFARFDRALRHGYVSPAVKQYVSADPKLTS